MSGITVTEIEDTDSIHSVSSVSEIQIPVRS